MDRRKFFKRGFNKIAGTVIDAAESHVQKKAMHWIRPPFAREELDFLLACTRCDECIDACPYDVIFSLPLSRGASVAGTPALDILNKGCHLCADWPCVNACKPEALLLPNKSDEGEVPGDIDNPRLAIAKINTHQCLPYLGPECGACRDSCPVPDTLLFTAEKPTINADRCVGCGLCREACIAKPNAIEIQALKPEDRSI